jgi:filamentous hemagglutinin
MAKLPNIDQAIIEKRKITAYLLDRGHPLGGPKAVFFERFGFSAADWQRFRDALLAHARANDIARSYRARHGQVYEVTGPLATPDGREPTVLVAWMVREGEDRPRLVTAVPSRGRQT